MKAPRSPRNSVKDSLVVAFMDLVSQRPLDQITTTMVCVRSGVHRTSFYRYFEDIDDLESQFLHLYFHKTFGIRTPFPTTAAELVTQYEALLGALLAQRAFFSQAMQEPRLLKYSNALKSLIEDWLRSQFTGRVEIADPDLWELNLQFALGTIFRLCEIVFRSKTDLSVAEMSRWMLEFLWGGRTFLVQAVRRGGLPALAHVDRRLRDLDSAGLAVVS